tara:strand:+ start:349 stop:576 length:228 start_codon:yes stop_codon:yes gene_type:complete
MNILKLFFTLVGVFASIAGVLLLHLEGSSFLPLNEPWSFEQVRSSLYVTLGAFLSVIGVAFIVLVSHSSIGDYNA